MLGLALSVWVYPRAIPPVTPPQGFIPALDFTDARNSGYAAVIGI